MDLKTKFKRSAVCVGVSFSGSFRDQLTIDLTNEAFLNLIPEC